MPDLMRHPLTVAALASVLAALVGAGCVLAAGVSPGAAGSALWDGMFGTDYAIGISLNQAALLILVGGGFVVAERTGLINIGGEGQICIGALAATAVGVNAGGLPAAVAVPLVLVAGFAGGAVWAFPAAWLKVRRGTSEVITTLLLNFVGLGLVSLAVHENALLRQPVTSAETLPQSEPLAAGAHLPLLGLVTSPATIAIVLALVAAIGLGILLRGTATGLKLTAVGLSAPAAARLGLPVTRLEMASLACAGGFAGLAGAALVATAPFVLSDGFSSGYGFQGLVVGLLGRGSMLGVVAAALLFGFLNSGGINLQLVAQVPAATVQIVQSLLVISIAGAMLWTREANS